MQLLFYVAGLIAILSTVMALTRVNAVHALLYLILSLLAVALVFYMMGAPLIAALEVIIYAGAIMVLFVFVIMMLNLGIRSIESERRLLTPGIWVGPAVLAAILIAEVAAMLHRTPAAAQQPGAADPKQVATALLGPYLIGVELSSILMMAGLVGAYHLGWRGRVKSEEVQEANDTRTTGAVARRDTVLVGSGRSADAP
jgi:NADH-quinone oxidoreductase subunit J